MKSFCAPRCSFAACYSSSRGRAPWPALSSSHQLLDRARNPQGRLVQNAADRLPQAACYRQIPLARSPRYLFSRFASRARCLQYREISYSSAHPRPRGSRCDCRFCRHGAFGPKFFRAAMCAHSIHCVPYYHRCLFSFLERSRFHCAAEAGGQSVESTRPPSRLAWQWKRRVGSVVFRARARSGRDLDTNRTVRRVPQRGGGDGDSSLSAQEMTETLWAVYSFVIGACFGSFLNVCISRWPEGLSVVSPRSRCPKCERPITALENIPLVSWIILRGKCRGCANPI